LDNLTHSLFGLTLARTGLGRAGRGTSVALLLASNAPDIDIVTTSGGALRYLEWHRGPTHGPLGLIGLSFITAGLVWFGRQRWDRRHERDRASFAGLWFVSIVGVLFHVLMDLPTSYGTRPFSPFNWTWFTTDWLPIVDIYMLAILGACLWFGRKAPARNAALALLLVAANYGLRATTHHLALVRAPEVFGAPLPAPCAGVPPQGAVDRWPRPRPLSPDAVTTTCRVDIAAMPDFISPFRWRLIAQLTNSYEIRDINLLDGLAGTSRPTSTVRRVSTRFPNQWTPSVEQAARSDVGRVFLGFSRFPAARSLREADDRTVVRWSDMRFATGVARNGQRSSGLFSTVIEVGPGGEIYSQRLGP
jgi:inner membrane protein